MQTNDVFHTPSDTTLFPQALSAWMDGEALPPGVNGQELLAWAMHDDHARQMWQCWHASADAVRALSGANGLVGGLSRPAVGSAAWLGTLQTRLADTAVASESSLQQAATDALAAPVPSIASSLPASSRAPARAANDSVFVWKMAAGFASFAVVGLLAWNMLAPAWSSKQQAAQTTAAATVHALAEPQVASTIAPSSHTAAPEAGSIDKTMSMLLQAHAQLGEQTLLQDTAQGEGNDFF